MGATRRTLPSFSSRMPQEEIARRLLETQNLVARFGQENERLAAEIGRMRVGGRGAPGDYKGARHVWGVRVG